MAFSHPLWLSLMKKILKSKIFYTFITFILILSSIIYIFWGAYNSYNFRTSKDTIYSWEDVDLNGLRDLNISGSDLVRFPELKFRIDHQAGPIIIVDGMSEPHGYLDGIPTVFFYYLHEEPRMKHFVRRWLYTGTTAEHPEWVISEAEEARKNGIDYQKVNIGSAYVSPDPEVDELIAFLDSVPENAWLHFHCLRGRGRTTIMMTMYDIMKNAPQVSLHDIVRRQHLIGAEDLFNLEVWKTGTYDRNQLEQRKQFIEKFYQFIVQRKAGGIQKWSEWNAPQKE